MARPKNDSERFICRNCGYIGDTEEKKSSSGIITGILFIFYIIPAIIHAIWRSSTKYESCASCGSKDIIPLDSPIGQKLQSEIGVVPNSGYVPSKIQKKQETVKAKQKNGGIVIFLLFVVAPIWMLVQAMSTVDPYASSPTAHAASTEELSGNVANNRLLGLPQEGKNKMLGRVIGNGCEATSAFYMGLGENGMAKNHAFWSVKCANDRSYAVELFPDVVGSTRVISCATLKSVNAGTCFKKLSR